VTWNPSVVSVCKASLYCPTTEEYILPVIHGNDRVEWFVQLTDEIQWEVEDRDTGVVWARVTMRAGDVAAMPADIRHRGFSPKRSMLLVWENASPELPALYASGKMPPAPVPFYEAAMARETKATRRLHPRRAFLRGVVASGAALALGGVLPGRAAAQRGTRPLKIGYVSPQTGPLAGFGETDSFVLG